MPATDTNVARAKFEKAFKDWQECQSQVRQARAIRDHATDQLRDLEKKEAALLKIYDTTPHWH